jgi:hypothetical protein
MTDRNPTFNEILSKIKVLDLLEIEHKDNCKICKNGINCGSLILIIECRNSLNMSAEIAQNTFAQEVKDRFKLSPLDLNYLTLNKKTKK